MRLLVHYLAPLALCCASLATLVFGESPPDFYDLAFTQGAALAMRFEAAPRQPVANDLDSKC